MPFPDKSFDLIISNEVVEHLTNPEAAVRHMARLLAPEGILVLVFPNRAIRAHLGMMVEKLWDTILMLVDPEYIHPRFEMPPFDGIGHDADATYITHPWEVQRMVRRSGLRFRYKSLLRGRLVAQK
jgi:SAM-dependent methyltransferase